MPQLINRQWRIARRPVGLTRESDFEWFEDVVQGTGRGQVLIRNQYVSMEPMMRARFWQEDADLPTPRVGDVMSGYALGVVMESRCPEYPCGSVVEGEFGWQDYALLDGRTKAVSRLPAEWAALPPHMGLLGRSGLAAYFGLMEIGEARQGETLVVSSAAGSVGSIVGQIGRLAGCRVVGLAGTDEKCRWIVDRLGFDAAINYKSEPVFKRLKQTCPTGVDIYFDNVGGPVLEDVLNLLKPRGRVVVCGMLSVYNDVAGALAIPPGPNNLINLMSRRARMEGFSCTDFRDRTEEAYRALIEWHAAGRLLFQVNVVDGLKEAPKTFIRIFGNTYRGKTVVKIS